MLRWTLVVLALGSSIARADVRPPDGATANVDRVAASVNHHVIWQSEVEDRQVGSNPPLTPQAALAELIDEEVVHQRAHKLRVEVDAAEVDAALVEIKKQNQLDDTGLDKVLEAQHYTRTRYRRELARQIERLRTIRIEVDPTVTVKDPAERRIQIDAATATWTAKLRAAARIEVRP